MPSLQSTRNFQLTKISARARYTRNLQKLWRASRSFILPKCYRCNTKLYSLSYFGSLQYTRLAIDFYHDHHCTDNVASLLVVGSTREKIAKRKKAELDAYGAAEEAD